EPLRDPFGRRRHFRTRTQLLRRYTNGSLIGHCRLWGTTVLAGALTLASICPPWPPALCPSASARRHHRRSAHPAGRTGSASPHCPNACIYFTFHASRLTFNDPIPLIILPSMILPLLPVK